MSNKTEIPQILHQIWIQGWDEMPPHYKAYSTEWRKHHPGWEYMFWDELKLVKLITQHAPQYLKRFLSYSQPVLKADFGRVMALCIFGGIYLDTDTQCNGTFNSRTHFPDPQKVYLSEPSQ